MFWDLRQGFSDVLSRFTTNIIKKNMSQSFINQIFRKSIDELTLEDIEVFFSTAQEETSVLEFKSGDVEINDIFKEIAAFLNTEGGLLIIGAPKEEKIKLGKNTIARCQGELTYSKFKNKDALYQKIASNITPCPTHIKIKEFHSEEGAVYVLDIPQSVTPPHQSNADGRYYIRLEAIARPAPHGLVQALFDKRRRPRLTADLNIEEYDKYADLVSISVRNTTNIPADKVGFVVDVYNIGRITGHEGFNWYEDDYLGPKFSYVRDSNALLVNPFSINVNFKVEHLTIDYLIIVGFYSLESEFDFRFWTYNPVNKEMVNSGDLNDSELTFSDALDRVNELRKVLLSSF